MKNERQKPGIEKYYRVAEAATLLGVSRGSVYNVLRGKTVVSFAREGKKGTMLIPETTLRELLAKNTRVLR